MIKIRKEREETIVSLFQVRKLNTLISGIIYDQLEELFNEKPGLVYFDLSRISFIDSSGFEMLGKIAQKAREYQSELILCNISDEVEELVSLTRAGEKIRIIHKELSAESLLLEVE